MNFHISESKEIEIKDTFEDEEYVQKRRVCPFCYAEHKDKQVQPERYNDCKNTFFIFIDPRINKEIGVKEALERIAEAKENNIPYKLVNLEIVIYDQCCCYSSEDHPLSTPAKYKSPIIKALERS